MGQNDIFFVLGPIFLIGVFIYKYLDRLSLLGYFLAMTAILVVSIIFICFIVYSVRQGYSTEVWISIVPIYFFSIVFSVVRKLIS